MAREDGNNGSLRRIGQPESAPDKTAGFADREKADIVVKPASSPVKAYTVNLGRSRAPSLVWESPQWDLAECGRIIDTESIVRRAFSVKEALFTKEGYEFVGQKPERVAYIKRRLRQMENAGGTPFPVLMDWTINSLIRMSNGFWVKRRDKKASGGGVRTTKTNKTLKPIAAYFPLPAETVRFKRDEYGKIKMYRQEVYGKEPVEFNPDDVIHYFFDRREGFSVGTPVLAPIKDDIRALRRIEENIELLVYAHLFPLYHYKVGTESAPAMTYQEGLTEVEIVQREIQAMPADGCWVTPERHSIDVLGAEGEALDTKSIIEHFKQRIYSGLGVSSVDMGEGGTSNRSTAQTMSRNLVDRTKAEQKLLESFINKFVIEELLLESSFPKDTLLDEENMVRLVFKEIDNEARQALENHANQLYLQNGLSHDEMREYIGREPFTEEEWEKSYWRQIDEPTKLIQALDEPYCQSKDTEVLTAVGWKLFKDLNEYDKVATLKDGKYLVYEMPVERLEFNYKGKMYLLQSRFIDACVTPNHRLYTCKYNQKHYKTKHVFELKRADEVFGEYKKFKRSAEWHGEESGGDVWWIGGTTIKKNQYATKELPPVSYRVEDWMEFLGWYLSEGYLDHSSNGYRIGICQDLNANPDNCQQIEDLLERMHLTFRHDGKQFVFSDPRIYHDLKEYCPGSSHEKYIPDYMRRLSSRLIKIFLNSLMAGDGEVKYHYLYSTASKQLADGVQELALKAGYSANIRIESRDGASDIYRVAINRDKYRDVADRMKHGPEAQSLVEEWIDYDDKVYSVRTSSGVIYVRRNGKARWCGNSPLAQAVARANTTSVEEPDVQESRTQKEKERREELAAKRTPTKPQALPTRKSTIKQNKTGQNRNRPRNQHGTRSSAKLNRDFYDAFEQQPDLANLDVIFAQTPPIGDLFESLKQGISLSIRHNGFEEDRIKTLIGTSFEIAKERLIAHSKRSYRIGINDTGIAYWQIRLDKTDSKIERHVAYYTNKLRKDLFKNIKRNVIGTYHLRNDDAIQSEITMDALAHRARMIDESEVMRAYNAGKADGYKSQGVEIISVSRHSSQPCETCDRSTLQWTESDVIIYEDLPPLHPLCRCVVRKAQGE